MRRAYGLMVSGLLAALLWSSGCGGGCSALEPAPAPMPPQQTIEGGFQVRVTRSGLQKLSSELPGLMNAALQNLSIEERQIVANIVGTLTLCPNGCDVNASVEDVSLVVSDPETLTVHAAIAFDTALVFYGDPIVGGDFTCTFTMATQPGQPVVVDVDIGFYVRDEDGELRIQVQGIRNVDVSGLEFHVTECGYLTDVLDWFADLVNNLLDWLDDVVRNPIAQWLADNVILPWLQPYIDSLLPDPMGVEGQVDVGSLVQQFSPSTQGKLEVRLVPGGYVNLLHEGISMGVITGLNSDADPTTRDDSEVLPGVKAYAEPARCVPPFETFDLEPYVVAGDMTRVAARGTYAMKVASELNGSMDESELVYQSGDWAGQPADVGIGVSRTFFNLAGFHAVNSGALCLTMGTEQVSMLTVGLFGVVVPSLADLIDPHSGDAPMLMVVRPQAPIEFSIGEGTEDSPLLDAFFKDFQVDIYPFTEDRYVRALTLGLDMHVGINLEAEPNQDGTGLVVVPTILGLSEDNVTVRVHNSELIAEDPEELEAMLPGILSMIAPVLTSALGSGFPLPTLGNGTTLDKLEFRPNNRYDMLLVLASIRQGNHNLPLPPVDTRLRLRALETPDVEVVREGLRRKRAEDLPGVVLDVEVLDPYGTGDYEWQYRLDGGLWHPFRTGSRLEIHDPLFVFQGTHRVQVRARRKGAVWSLDRTPAEVSFTVDFEPPLLAVDREGDQVRLVGFDLVTPRDRLRYAVAEGEHSWRTLDRPALSLDEARRLAAATGGRLGVSVTDEAGHRTVKWVTLQGEAPQAPQPGPGVGWLGCSTAGAGTGLFWVLLLAGLALLRRRRLSLLVLVLGLGSWIACSDEAPGGNGNENNACVDFTDCEHLQCQEGQAPDCVDGTCQCVDDLPLGQIGTHSSLAIVPGPVAYVAAYNRTYGDLMLARFSPPGIVPHRLYEPGGHGWEFVDGVPGGPVDYPHSEVRGGVSRKGDDVGTHTAIGVTLESRNPMIAYRDETHGSVKFAWFDGENWHIHVVDDGGSEDPEQGDAGYYIAMSQSRTDGKPAIAYVAPRIPTQDPNEPFVCQLRYAEAMVETPSAPEDWVLYVVDQVVVPERPEDAPPEDWPACTGLHVSMFRKSDDSPVLAYYDSVKGNLVMSELVTEADGTKHFSEPLVVAGQAEDGSDTGDVGLFPSVFVTESGGTVYHYSFADRRLRRLYYYNTTMDGPVVVDDGYRMETNPVTGRPMPVSHFVGWDSKLYVSGDTVFVAYQDGTSHELRIATTRLDQDPTDWRYEVLAGDEPAFQGAYGFYINFVVHSGTAYLSSYVINEHAQPDQLGGRAVRYFVEIFERPIQPE